MLFAENDYLVISLKELAEYIDPVLARKSIEPKMVNPDGTPIIQVDVRHFSAVMSPQRREANANS